MYGKQGPMATRNVQAKIFLVFRTCTDHSCGDKIYACVKASEKVASGECQKQVDAAKEAC